MEKKMDLRVYKTYTALTTAFIQLLEKKSFDDITIQELCELATIRRATFYKHFTDKYEFFVFMIKCLETQFYEKNPDLLTHQRSKYHYIKLIHYTLDFISHNEALVKSIFKNSVSAPLLSLLTQQTTKILEENLKEDIKHGAVFPASPEVLASFMIGAFIHTISWWISTDMQMPKETLVKQLIDIIDKF